MKKETILQPEKGWKYRLILVDEEGTIVVDDYRGLRAIREGIDFLLERYIKKKLDEKMREK